MESEFTPVYVHTKGHAVGNVGAWACAVSMPSGASKIEIQRGTVANETHNAMEIHAATIAIKLLKRPCYVTLFTNSQYLIKGILKLKEGKLPDVNVDWWVALRERITYHGHAITCCHILKIENTGLMRQVDHEAFNLLPPDLRWKVR
jgi:ribonuclease HI